MNQVLTPEELAALFEGLREPESGPGFLPRDLPQEIRSRGRGVTAPRRITRCQHLSNWLMVLADLRWPHL
jgi:hypothetical protein